MADIAWDEYKHDVQGKIDSTLGFPKPKIVSRTEKSGQ